ncbi:MAG: ABC transporter ATP-binding protein [Byssovorax sp.]
MSDEVPTFENAPPISMAGAPLEPEPTDDTGADLGPPPAIRVRHLWHRFGQIDVLRDVTFDVGPGEIFGFIGPNGAGKTTTIRVMATLLEPMAGRVEIDGIDVSIDPDEVRKRIGYMPDHAGVYERITVREYLEFFADAFQVPSLGVVDAVLELTDLGKIQDRIVATMSKGMKQRLQLGRILLHDPKVLILDEPASDLDPRARIEIRDLLLELRSLGKTIFLSSHILTELSDVCTSIGILEKGRLVVAGPIGEIANRLEMVRAAQAVGHAPPRPSMGRGQVFYPPQQHPHYPPQQGPAPQPGYVPQQQQAYAPQPGYAPQQPRPQPDGSWAADRPRSAPAPAAPVAPVGPPAPQAQGWPTPPQPRRKVKLRVLGNPEMAAYFLRGGPGILEVELVGGAVHVGYVGTDVKIAEIVQHLVRNQIGVVGVEPERNELERIFLEVTRGEAP